MYTSKTIKAPRYKDSNKTENHPDADLDILAFSHEQIMYKVENPISQKFILADSINANNWKAIMAANTKSDLNNG